MDMKELLRFTEMTGDVVKAMRTCPQPIIAAIDGICAGAGAILAMGSDMRYGTADSKTAFLFTRVGLAGCDMGACSILPRIIGQGRASELLYTGRSMSGEESYNWGFFNKLCDSDKVLSEAQEQARRLADGPTFAHGITKRQLHMEWNMSVEDAITVEAEAQAICMQTQDFQRAYDAFAAKQKPVFEGN
jgi:enoyl-CoA hydratase/carnithine racemase